MCLSLCQSMGLVGQISRWLGRWRSILTVDLEGFSGIGFDPFPVDVGYILFEKRWVIQLVGHISEY